MKVWYISKYASGPDQNFVTRQYFFSKYFSRKGVSVSLISSDSCGAPEHLNVDGPFRKISNNGFDHYILRGYKIQLGFNFRRIVSWVLFELRLLFLPKRAKIEKPDIIIVSSLSLITFLTAIYFKKKYKCKLIVEVRDIWPQTLIDLKGFSRLNPFVILLKYIEKAGYRNADCIVGTMARLDVHIQEILKTDNFCFRYIPMGFDPETFPKIEEDNSVLKSVLPKNKFLVGYAGSIGRVNRVDLILETARILEENERIHFLILGDGPQKEFLINRFKFLNNVTFVPRVKKDSLQAYLSTCNLLVIPWENSSIYKYGVSPNKYIDYMYAAKPIIVPYNGYRNIINEANCGEFIDTDNPQLFAETILKYAVKQPEELKIIGMNGRNYLQEKLVYSILANKYIDLMKGLL